MTEWRKSRRSGTQENMTCVEVANLAGNIGVRDSKNPTGPVLAFDRTQLAQFFGRIKNDEI
jgi:Domain of unknown function (DUF397)